jgi:hypothetical protein
MKHHKWRETIQEKILFHTALQLQDHREKVSGQPLSPTRSAPRAASFDRSASHFMSTFHGSDGLPWQRSVDGWWVSRPQLGLGNFHYCYPIDGKPTFDLHAIKLVHNEFYERLPVSAAF